MSGETIRLETVERCLLCGEAGRSYYRAVRDTILSAPGTWQYAQCPACAFVWLTPRPVIEDLGKVYQSYFTHVDGTIPPKPSSRWRQAVKHAVLEGCFDYGNGRQTLGERLRPAAGRLLALLPGVKEAVGMSVMQLPGASKGRLLDVGCGNGRFVLWMKELGWDGVGVEPDADAAEVGRTQYGAPVLTGQVHDPDFPAESFDAVTLHHVIEHVHDPVGVLRECYRILKPGGRLVMATPNYRSWGHRLFRSSWLSLEVPRHLFLFSMRSLARCTEQAGFDVVLSKTSTRWVSWLWSSSLLIRLAGRLPTRPPRLVRGGLAALGLVVQTGMTAIRPLRPEAGDELVLVARKPGTP